MQSEFAKDRQILMFELIILSSFANAVRREFNAEYAQKSPMHQDGSRL